MLASSVDKEDDIAVIAQGISSLERVADTAKWGTDTRAFFPTKLIASRHPLLGFT